jgi:hypothetical protein
VKNSKESSTRELNGRSSSRLSWWVLLSPASVALLLFVPIMAFGDDYEELLYVFLAAPLLTVIWASVVLVRALARRRMPGLSILVTFPLFWVVTLALSVNSAQIHSLVRWTFHSREFKARVLSREPEPNALRHTIWTVGGFAGENTVIYLVFDPNNSLESAALSKKPGKFAGLPCEVFRVRRLESQWYTTQFYTDSEWDRCG